jgi:fibronectin type III domain-containing protein 3
LYNESGCYTPTSVTTDEQSPSSSPLSSSTFMKTSDKMPINNSTTNEMIPSPNVDHEMKSQQDIQLDAELSDNYQFFLSILNQLKEPQVTEIEAQSVLVFLSPIQVADIKVTDDNNNDNDNDNVDTDNINKFKTIKITSEMISKFDNVNYTLELSVDGQLTFKHVYSGDANEITLKDLKPNTKYFIRAFASLTRKCRGDYTAIVSFETKQFQPDPPSQPKMISKKKNEISLRWPTNSNDNGSKIINFILECQKIESNLSLQSKHTPLQPHPPTTTTDDTINEEEETTTIPSSNGTKDCGFVEIYRGNGKQFIVKKLSPSTCYAFRLAAENSIGQSEYSQVTFIYTSGSVPNVPSPPQLDSIDDSSISLIWGLSSLNNFNNNTSFSSTSSPSASPTPSTPTSTNNDIKYELQMQNLDDPIASSHGFITVYNGSALNYKVNELKRSSVYQFRLRAHNEEGYSGWCDVVSFKTNAQVPQPPSKLKIKQQTASLMVYQVNWEEPKDNGTLKVLKYYLEILETESDGFRNIFEGKETSFLLNIPMKPNHNYKLRVKCSNSVGISDYSDPIDFTTPPIKPGKCDKVKLQSKPKGHSIQLKWDYPDSDGGSPIIHYEIGLILIDNNNEISSQTPTPTRQDIVYKGSDLFCTIDSLLLGRDYLITVRPSNRIGCGLWSDSLLVTSGSGSPETPKPPTVQIKSATCLILNWHEPVNNGSPIIEYIIELSVENEPFEQVATTPATTFKFEIKNLIPDTHYSLRIQAINSNGASQFSNAVECSTPPSVPGQVTILKLEGNTENSLTLSWKQPITNGSPILSYNLDIIDTTTTTTTTTIVYNTSKHCEYKVESLRPDWHYKVRIQAVNSIGVGHYSNQLKVKTKASPPLPPNLECISTTYNSIRIKWPQLSNSSSLVVPSNSLDLTIPTLMQLATDNHTVYLLEMKLKDKKEAP